MRGLKNGASGFGITRDGRLWMLHQQLRPYGQKEDPDENRTVFLSHSGDGGRTWVDGTRSGTNNMNRSTQFLEILGAATVELEPDRFFTAYKIMAEPRGDQPLGSVQGYFWDPDRGSGKFSG